LHGSKKLLFVETGRKNKMVFEAGNAHKIVGIQMKEGFSILRGYGMDDRGDLSTRDYPLFLVPKPEIHPSPG
jgi:hypothetical protein